MAPDVLPAPDGSATYEWDLLDGIDRYSAAAIALVGGDPASFGRATWTGCLDAVDCARVEAEQEAALASASAWDVTYTVRPAHGPVRLVRDRAVVVRDGARATRVVGVIEEIDRAADGAADAGGERLLGAIVNFIPQLCWSADANGWLDYYNDRWYEYTGTTPEQMEGWGWVAVHDPYDLARMLKVWRNALATGEPWQDEFRLRRGSDGALRWHLSRAMPLRDATGRIVRWFGTNTDVHDQKLAAEDYTRLLAREQHLRREADAANRAKDEFLAILSHELRTPLAVILNTVALLRTGPPAAKQRELIDRIERNARHQTKLVSDLLDTSRIIAGKLAVEAVPVELTGVVEGAVEAVRAEAESKGVVLSCASGPTDAWVRGDAARLLQAVGNLLQNAVKFTDRGKRVHAEVLLLPDDVEVIVRDEGAGIPPDRIAKLFRRFTQADTSSTRRQGGLGLGLAIARELVERQGGRIFAESDGPGHGATFTIRMPRLIHADQPLQARDAAPSIPVPLAGVRVLVVDDESDMRATISEILIHCGANVSAVSSAREALHAFRFGAPDVVVSDIAMPDMDGYDLVRAIRQLPGDAARTSTIALTAYASIEHRERSIQAGFDAYLAKPTDAATLSGVIADLCRRRALSGA